MRIFTLLSALLFVILGIPSFATDVPQRGDHMAAVYSTNTAKVEVDMSSIAGKLPIKTAIIAMLDLSDGSDVYATVGRFEFDCNKNTMKPLSVTQLDGSLNVLHDKKITNAKAAAIPEKSIGGKLEELVCGRPPAIEFRAIPGKQIETQE